MMRISMTLIILVFQVNSIAQIDPERRKDDMDLIDSVTKLDKSKPSDIEGFFSSPRYLRLGPDKLGFGWTKVEKEIGGGYISIRADFFYFRDTLKAYILYAYLPNEAELRDEYRSAYLKLLPVYNGQFYSFGYKEQTIQHPLDNFAFSNRFFDSTAQLLAYMSPASGIVYGYTGGFFEMTLENRRNFEKIEKNLSPDQMVEIMYSVNPASRLTAIEYYMRHKRKFKGQPLIDKWIENVYKELPYVESVSGCVGFRTNAKLLVERFAKSKRY